MSWNEKGTILQYETLLCEPDISFLLPWHEEIAQTILKNPWSAELKSCGKNLLVSAQFVARNE